VLDAEPARLEAVAAMDPVIRAPRMATGRARLRPAGGASCLDGEPCGGAARRHPGPPEEDSLTMRHRALEAELRAGIAAQAQADFAAERERGRALGHAEGRREGRAEARKSALAAAREAQVRRDARLARAIEALAEAQRQAERRLEAALGEIAFAAVCRLAGEASASRDWIRGSVAAACAQLHGETRARVRLHPADLARLDPQGDGELRLAGLVLRLAADAALTPGGCELELALGGVDATLETRLARLRATLLAATGEGAP
jgi:flagellar assembly protein FliH